MKKLVSLKMPKDINIKKDLVILPAPDFIYIEKKSDLPLNTKVYKDDKLDGEILSISGIIKDYVYKKINKKVVLCYEIENDYKDERRHTAKISKKYANLTKQDFLNSLREKELTNYYDIFVNNSNALVINCADERLYEYNKVYRIKKIQEEFLENINYIKEILCIDMVYLVFKESNETILEDLINKIGLYTNIIIKLLPNKCLTSTIYLNNYLKLDDYILLGSEDIYNIIENIKKNKRVTDSMVSIYNDLNKTIEVKNIRLNSSLIELFNDEMIDFSLVDIYINGYLYGYIEKNIEDLIMTKEITNIVILKKDSLKRYDCINCGACNKVCPLNINVKKLYDHKLMSNKCLNCGLCNYICPANIDLKEIILGDNDVKQ